METNDRFRERIQREQRLAARLRLATVQAFEPIAAPAERFPLARPAGLKVGGQRGAGRLRTWGGPGGPAPAAG